MHIRPLPLACAIGAIGILAVACSSSSGPPPNDTCAFVDDTNNCYRRLVAAVDACLSDGSADGGPATPGKLSADGTSCAYANGRSVTFVGDARKYDAANTPMDVTITQGNKTCVHFVSKPSSSMTITGPDGATLTGETAGATEILTCPDGSKHGIDALTLLSGCGDAGLFGGGGIPGVQSSGGGSQVSGGLLGGKGLDYDCTQ